MVKSVVIDKDVLGWARDRRRDLLKRYEKILEVGELVDLPQRSFDSSVASYCKKNDCDLLTSDKTAYTHYFEKNIRTVKINRYGWYEKGDRPVYLIEIVD
tara:strand:- start:120 stop:419 length:300 start_codon:yes stop_codon:yes gene_type:complete